MKCHKSEQKSADHGLNEKSMKKILLHQMGQGMCVLYTTGTGVNALPAIQDMSVAANQRSCRILTFSGEAIPLEEWNSNNRI